MHELAHAECLMEEGSNFLFEATKYITPVLRNGEGSYVWDVDGNSYLDLNAGQFCLSFGHSYEPFIEMIANQMRKIYHTNTATITPEVLLAAKKVAEITEYDLSKTLFLSTGSEANECALRYAKFLKRKEGVISLDLGYHGLTLASQSSTMAGRWAMPKVLGTFSVPSPNYIHAHTQLSESEFLNDCICQMRKCFAEHAHEVCAMILEPVIGVGGMVPIPQEYLKEARKLCDEYGILLIFDECQCGFGRSGDWYVFKQMKVVPDILVTAKAMGMGLAVSAVTFRKSIARELEGKLTHFSSHQNDPLSAAIVTFVIDEIINKELLRRNEEKGKYLLECLEHVCSQTDLLCNPRGIGLMTAFDINDAKVGDYAKYSARFINAMEQNGVLIQAVRQGRTFRVMPSYLISEGEIDFLKDAMTRSVMSIR